MRTEPLRSLAYAKVNLSLEVLGRRDDGYHDIVTIMQTVDLADVITISASERLEVDCDDADLSGRQNIVWDAAVALAANAGIVPRARIEVEKRIPTAAGLGGGSADAAAALRGLNRFWDLGLSDGELLAVASKLGSDVPFLVTGGTALGTGRGDELEHTTTKEGVRMLLVVPPASIPRKTPTLYGALAVDDFSDGSRTRELFHSRDLASGMISSDSCQNAFTRAAIEIFPGLDDVWKRTSGITEHPPCLSGAGPAFFCMPSDQGERDAVEETLRDTGAMAYLVRTINQPQDV